MGPGVIGTAGSGRDGEGWGREWLGWGPGVVGTSGRAGAGSGWDRVREWVRLGTGVTGIGAGSGWDGGLE